MNGNTIELIYFYYIGYSHGKGNGWLEIQQDHPITTAQNLKEIENGIAHSFPITNPVITNFTLLRREKKK